MQENIVYSRHTTGKQSAETAEASLSGEQSGTTPSTSMNAPTQSSEGKGSEKSDTRNGNHEKKIFARLAILIFLFVSRIILTFAGGIAYVGEVLKWVQLLTKPRMQIQEILRRFSQVLQRMWFRAKDGLHHSFGT